MSLPKTTTQSTKPADSSIACPRIDEAASDVINHILRSPRMRAASIALSQRVGMLEALDQAGFNVTNASVLVLFEGHAVRTVLKPDDHTELKGGGHVSIGP